VVIAIVKKGDICELVVYNHACYAVRCSDDLYCKPFLKGLRFYMDQRQHRKPVVAIFLVLIVSSYATEVLTPRCLSFMAGAIMPDVPKFRTIFIEKVEDVALILLPLFCIYRFKNRNWSY
jgi:hypothetical protein